MVIVVPPHLPGVGNPNPVFLIHLNDTSSCCPAKHALLYLSTVCLQADADEGGSVAVAALQAVVAQFTQRDVLVPGAHLHLHSFGVLGTPP